MKTSTYLAVFGWLSFLFGAAFLALPAQVLPLYGVANDPSHLLLARYFGVALAGGGILPWMLRHCEDSAVVANALTACAIAAALGLVATAWGLVDKTLGPLGWSSIVIYGLLLLAALYLGRSTRAAATVS